VAQSRFRAAFPIVRDAALVVASILLLVSAVSFTLLQLSGTTFYRITSPSMTGTLDVGAVVAVRAAEPWTIEVGDVIAIGDEDVEVPTVHRVVQLQQQFPDVRQVFTDSRDGSPLGERWQRAPRSFITKGDANPSNDPRPVTEDQLRGRVVFQVPAMLRFLPGLASQGTLLVVGIGSFVLYALWQGWDIAKAVRRRRAGTVAIPADAEAGEPVAAGDRASTDG
jgi:signal peptidase I